VLTTTQSRLCFAIRHRLRIKKRKWGETRTYFASDTKIVFFRQQLFKSLRVHRNFFCAVHRPPAPVICCNATRYDPVRTAPIIQQSTSDSRRTCPNTHEFHAARALIIMLTWNAASIVESSEACKLLRCQTTFLNPKTWKMPLVRLGKTKFLLSLLFAIVRFKSHSGTSKVDNNYCITWLLTFVILVVCTAFRVSRVVCGVHLRLLAPLATRLLS